MNDLLKEQRDECKLWAVIDIGTVTARLLIARLSPAPHNRLLLAEYAPSSAPRLAILQDDTSLIDSCNKEACLSSSTDLQGVCIEELSRSIEICNLGLGVASTKEFSGEALARTEEALVKFSNRIKDFGVMPDRCIVFATSATRDARNSYLLEEIISKIGLRLEIISGQDEAIYSFRGASFGSSISEQIVLDVGGGSSEFAYGSKGIVQASHSFDIGARRVTELFFKHDPIRVSELDSARAWIEEQFVDFFEQLRHRGCVWQQLIAVAGSATSLAAILQRLSPYDPHKVHGYVITREALEDLLELVAGLCCQEREKLVGLQPQRAGVIVGGTLVLSCALAASGLKSMTVSESDILQGILLSRAAELGF